MLCDVPLTSPVRGAKRPLPEAASSLRPTKQPRTASAGLQPILTAPSLWSIFLGARSVRAAPVRAGLPAPIASTAAGASIAQLQTGKTAIWIRWKIFCNIARLSPPAVTLNLAYARATVTKPLPTGFMGADKRLIEEVYLEYLTELEQYYNDHNKNKPSKDHVKTVMIPSIARRYQLDLWVKAEDENKPNFDLETLAKIQAAIMADLSIFSECQTKDVPATPVNEPAAAPSIFVHPEAGTLKPGTPHFVHGRLERLTAHATANGKMSWAVFTARDKSGQPFIKNAARTVLEDNAQVVVHAQI
ncbi:hypothetical protein HDU90_003805 [Geranomyces variabilis]|nr:hypothetical protein HDU90_003805 [Geranomyces variabilis]